MKLIQFILIPLLALVVIVYFARFRSRLLDRLIVLAFGILGIIMVFVPDWANVLAHSVSVGRGADLIMYLGLIGLTFLCLALYSKLREIEVKLTKLARTEALEHARLPEQNGG
ncbi:MAG TPA: DUF2304 domain-containing protein [Pyrinomonadaceae bacterium]|nr:DUF2304 domain-containing protein [Pyrinomonadaceae bacterium]